MGILQAWVRFLSKCIVSECPDDRIERNREERIRRLYQDVALLASMHSWEEQTRQDRISRRRR